MGAICKHCNQDMETAGDCTENREIDYPGGEVLKALPYTNEYVLESEQAEHRCHDCGVRYGAYHHPGCDMEICPRCGGQMIMCDCVMDEDDEDEDELHQRYQQAHDHPPTLAELRNAPDLLDLDGD
jgi:hypothetical protein